MASISITDGVMTTPVESQEATAFSVGSDIPQQAEGIATARGGSNESVRGSNVTPESLVRINGMELQVKQAVNMGWLVADGKGGYVDSFDTNKQSQQATRNPLSVENPNQANQQQNASEDVAQGQKLQGTSDNTEESYQDLRNRVSDAQEYHMLNLMSEGKELDETLVGELASNAGVEYAQMVDRLDDIQTGFALQAGQVISDHGLNPESVRDWAFKNAPQLMRSAIQRHVMNRSTDGYNRVAQEYMANLDKIDPDAILGASLGQGIHVGRDSQDNVIVSLPGGQQMKWESAVRAGIIKLSKV
jgi:hypothetical protein